MKGSTSWSWGSTIITSVGWDERCLSLYIGDWRESRAEGSGEVLERERGNEKSRRWP